MAENENRKEEDTIKLFVGQIPRHYDSDDVEVILSEFGEVFETTIIRDKQTQEHKGCAFVVYCKRSSALQAQANLHEKRTLPGMSHPMQVKPANSEGTPEECKLFIGMISKNTSEDDLRNMFSIYGTIEIVTVLKDSEGKSRGCAFLKFTNKSMAQKAMKSLNHSQTMPGCPQPMVVKIADTDRDKAMKKMHHQFNHALSVLGAMSGNYNHITQPIPLPSNSGIAHNHDSVDIQSFIFQQLMLQQQIQGLPGLGNMITNQTGSPHHTALATHGHHHHHHQGPHTHHHHQHSNQMNQGHNQLVPAHQSGDVSAPGIAHRQAFSMSVAADPIMSHNEKLHLSMYGANPSSNINMLSLQQTAATQRPGPEGANLFIYHLPQEFQDSDLISTFMPFGTVLSAKVYIDKQTNLSKCFGFVSYDNPLAASQAINSMNGFQIGNKRLKVQLKKSKASSSTKPY